MNYYNEFDPYTAQWLRNLIAAGLIPAGHVDTRSITDVQPDDLAGYRQCHFFAGIGGWSLAARLAGWPDDRELWTGSAPCQPFSVAGKGKAQADDRHLWPHLFRLARARQPAVLMGEQVAAAVGKDWIDGVFSDLEGIGYACGASVVPACAVDAPHRRDRLWFVAHAGGQGLAQRIGDPRVPCEVGGKSEGKDASNDDRADARALADADCCGRESWADHAAPRHWQATTAASGRSAWDSAGVIVGHDGKARRVEPSIHLLADGIPGRVAQLRAGGNAIVPQVAAEVIGAYMDCYPDPAEQLRVALATN
ncbi:DNA cytosine methyltransferase [Stenotrophomonas sp.]|uniref:DNA cytosine methyltransferase n=1 Tax=Stenotrophomonas sp. TaxID=69392 RepID=UPI0028A1F46D|nr:DNA cytosine methyltransferase [Stenotrophomonas sp.]